MASGTITARILIVDDNPNALKTLQFLLEREGLHVDTAGSGARAIERSNTGTYDVVVSDLSMPGIGGLQLLVELRRRHPSLPFIVLTAHGTVESAVDALRLGACDYIQKPFSPEAIVARVHSALHPPDATTALPQAMSVLPAGLEPDTMVGCSEAMKRIHEQIKTLASKDIGVVIYGESGTGKELAARALHDGSPRSTRPFVAVNCASLPETLLENELFGHVKGAYTGATGTQKGLFEEAHTGTIFLDEIGDISPSLQAKLLRVLQEHEFKKVGGTRDVCVDVRVLTATNRDLREAVATGKFREDLYYRINIVPLVMPPLRERTEDIPLLAHHFRNRCNLELSLAIRGFSEDAMAQMIAYPWPGNVRELRNRVKMAVVMARAPVIGIDDIGFNTEPPATAFPAFRDAKDDFERDYVVRALKLCGGNVKQAARLAGRDRSTFYDLLKKHEITAESYRHMF